MGLFQACRSQSRRPQTLAASPRFAHRGPRLPHCESLSSRLFSSACLCRRPTRTPPTCIRPTKASPFPFQPRRFILRFLSITLLYFTLLYSILPYTTLGLTLHDASGHTRQQHHGARTTLPNPLVSVLLVSSASILTTSTHRTRLHHSHRTTSASPSRPRHRRPRYRLSPIASSLRPSSVTPPPHQFNSIHHECMCGSLSS